MDRYLRAQPLASASSMIVHHASASKRLQRANTAASEVLSGSSENLGGGQDSQYYSQDSQDSELTQTSPVIHAATSVARSQEYPICSDQGVRGERFDVDFDHVYLNEVRLNPLRLGYAVRYKNQLKGGRELAAIWRYGLELAYQEDNGSLLKLWLCSLCHLGRSKNDSKKVNSYHHITEHMRKVHKTDPHTGLMPTTAKPTFGSAFDAARAAGSNTMFSHNPWQEESFQSTLVDWVILEPRRSVTRATELT